MVELGSGSADWAVARTWPGVRPNGGAAEALRMSELEGSVDPNQWLSVETLSFEPQEAYGPAAAAAAAAAAELLAKEEKPELNDALWELEPDDPYSRVPDKTEPCEQSPSFWSATMDFELSKLDAMFKADKPPEAPKDPTLAELNANDESGLDGLDVNDFLRDFQQANWSSYTAPAQLAEMLVPAPMARPIKGEILMSALSSSLPATSGMVAAAPAVPSPATLSPSTVSPSTPSPSTVSSSAPTAPLEVPGGKPRCRILAERLSCSAPESQLSQLSMDEGFSSQDSEDGLTSDAESHASQDAEPASPDGHKKKKRYFWQYNVQAKGPKGPRLSMARDSADPHVLHDVTDPVFSPECHLEGVKHAGKARRGDGNDLTPNPRKLYNIGMELKKLGRIINDLTPVSELPFNARHKSRKEKNKLASRACRLKKKAQHEANKLKLYGLQQEHKKLIALFEVAKKFMREQVECAQGNDQEAAAVKFDALVKRLVSLKVAGHSTEFVNRVLSSVAAGNPDGGLSDL